MGSAAGPDELRHLRVLLGKGAAEAAVRVCGTVTDFVNAVLLRGEVPAAFRAIFLPSHLSKKDGRVRPIAVGNILRRLAAKVGAHPISSQLGAELRPCQLDLSTKGGCEAAAHASRQYLASDLPNKVFLKIDMRNAFNGLRRDCFPSAARQRAPQLYILLCPSKLLYDRESSKGSHLNRSCSPSEWTQ